jgi:catechol 2,3-dioxygenase-like lactoylglutathione lyase family enzyme
LSCKVKLTPSKGRAATPKQFNLSEPAFVGLVVRDVARSAAFYKRALGFRRDPENFHTGVSATEAMTFLSYPVPFAVRKASPGVVLDALPRPLPGPAIWFKTADAQATHDALVAAGITILRPPTNRRFGRRFTLRDPDGYQITIYDRDAPPDGWEQSV